MQGIDLRKTKPCFVARQPQENYAGAAVKNGWRTRALGDVLQPTETVDPRRSPESEFHYVDVSSVSNQTLRIEQTQRLTGKEAPGRARRLIRTNDVLFATIRPTLRRIAIVPGRYDQQVCSTGYFVLRPKHEIDHQFLFYFLQTGDFMDQMGLLQKGASYPAVTDRDIRSQRIPVPPITEQRRIVAILDKAFAAIATAKANTEKNLQNAHELFEARLSSLFSVPHDGWVDSTVGAQITLQRGFDITKDKQHFGNVPVVSSGGIRSFHNVPMATAPGVVMGRKGTLGKVFYLEQDFWPHDTTLWVKDFHGNHPKLVYYFFRQLDVEHLDSGAANPALNRNQVHPIPVKWPPHSKQEPLVAELDKLDCQTRRLESLYQRKLAALDELRRSLLHHAFNGEL